MVIVEPGFLVRSSHGERYGTLGPLQASHYVPVYKGCYSTLDYILEGVNKPGTPFISTGVEKIYLYFRTLFKVIRLKKNINKRSLQILEVLEPCHLFFSFPVES